jgi:hypothetical protein
MDKKIAGLIGAVSSLAALDPAQAAIAHHLSDAMRAQSYDDLLEPIPNAVPLLQASDTLLKQRDAEASQAKVEMAQYYYHHHHHHRFFRPYYHHHHHRYFRPYYHHHHHHHYY